MATGEILDLIGVALDSTVSDLESLGPNASSEIVDELKFLGFLDATTAQEVKNNSWIGYAGFAIGTLAVLAASTPIGAATEAVGAAATATAATAVETLFADTAFTIFGKFVASEILAATRLMTAVATAIIKFVVQEGLSKITEIIAEKAPELADIVSKLFAAAPGVYNGTAVVTSIGLPSNVAKWDLPGKSTSYEEFSRTLSRDVTIITVTNSTTGKVTELIQRKGVTIGTLTYAESVGTSTLKIGGGKVDPSIQSPPYIEQMADDSVVIGMPDAVTGTSTLFSDSATGIVSVELGATLDASTGQSVLSFASSDFKGDTIDITNPTSQSTEIAIDIGEDDAFKIFSDAVDSGVTQDFDFMGSSGVLRIDDAADFTGTISGFVHGDIIDLMDIGTATSATLGANNVLTVESSHGSFVLNLSPDNNFTGDLFAVKSDGNGGTDIVIDTSNIASLGGIVNFFSADVLNNKGNVIVDGKSIYSILEKTTHTIWNSDSGADYGVYAINDDDEVVGYVNVPADNFFDQATAWRNGNITYLDKLPNDYQSYAYAVNTFGQVVGISIGADSPDDNHAVLWQNGTVTDLDPTNNYGSAAFDINNKGQIVGYAYTEYSLDACMWQNGTIDELPSLGNFAIAYSINSSGEIAGYSDVVDESIYHAVIWNSGVLTDMGTLGGQSSEARCVNDLGQVVGYSLIEDGAKHAFLWQNGKMTDLNSLLPAASSWVLDDAVGINDLGQIVGNGTINGGSSTGFVLTLSSTGKALISQR